MAINPIYTWPNTTGNVAYTGGTVSIQGPNTTSASNYYSVNTASALNGPVWSSSSNPSPYVFAPSGTSTPGIQCNGTLTADDVKIDGVSIKEMMTQIQDRLAILVPDPTKLEKFAALKASYEHYKLLEKLCTDNPPDVV